MTYDEFQEKLNEAINGDQNFATMYAQLVKFVYDMHQDIEKLKYENYKFDQDIETLRQYINDVKDGW
jgi:hypothetical protein